ncbi:MAG: mevalonate kinase [Desulfobacteraceae bacterium]|nr:mevalonate kinase [Desulfobacteraceae bacterium]
MAIGKAFGKTILIGDQFVSHEVPAIVSSISYVTEATVTRMPGDGWLLEDMRIEVPGYKAKKAEQQIHSINRILKVMGVDPHETPIRITYGGDLLAGSGVGSSAASCVSLARALNAEFNKGLTIDEINTVGWEGEFAYHGTPSGVDNTASTYGGLLFYKVENEQKSFEGIKIKSPFEIVLANSGVTADTSALGTFLKEKKETDPELFEKTTKTIKEQTIEMRRVLEVGDLKKVGILMTENHKVLIDFGLSHEKLIYLCNMALEKGALGAKVTGGGRGGYMIALTPGKDLQNAVASAMEKEGYKVIRATIGGN